MDGHSKTGKETNEKAYWNHEVAKLLEISDSTLRRWCIELEANGYVFIKGENESRAFTVHDLDALRFFKELVKVKRKTKETASKEVVERYPARVVTPPMQGFDKALQPVQVHEKIEELSNKIEQMKSQLDKQMEFNKQLIERMDQQSMSYIRELHETKKQIAISQEKKWWRFWK
jgi:DNA-binding transcriptional MerR regulator